MVVFQRKGWNNSIIKFLVLSLKNQRLCNGIKDGYTKKTRFQESSFKAKYFSNERFLDSVGHNIAFGHYSWYY